MEYFISDKKKIEKINYILGSTLAIYMLKGVITYRMVTKGIKKNTGIIERVLEKDKNINEEVNKLFTELKSKASNKQTIQEEIQNGIFSNIKSITNFAPHYSNIYFLNDMHKLYQSLSKEKSKSADKGSEK